MNASHKSTPGVRLASALLPSLRVLYVDDAPELRAVMRDMLRHEGHSVSCAADGLEAHELIAADQKAFDLVITDHNMPVMGGLELVACLRALHFPGKIVVLSSLIRPDDERAYRGFKVDAVLQKPITLEEIRGALDRLFAPPPRAMIGGFENPPAEAADALHPHGRNCH